MFLQHTNHWPTLPTYWSLVLSVDSLTTVITYGYQYVLKGGADVLNTKQIKIAEWTVICDNIPNILYYPRKVEIDWKKYIYK